jgi:hypothetical protein
MSLLIVHRDPYMAEELESMARSVLDAGSDRARVCPDMATARVELAAGGPPMALVVESDLPDGGRQAGLALAIEMRARWTDGMAIPVVVVATASDLSLGKAVAALPACALVCEGGNLERDFQYALRCLLAHAQGIQAPAVLRPPSYYIRIRVDADGNCDYGVRSVKTHVNLDSHVRFGVDRSRLVKLLDRLPKSLPDEGWALADRIVMYQEVGEELTRALFREQIDVAQEYGVLLGLTRSAPTKTQVGLCFTVDKAFYRLPFEALRLPTRGDAGRYWMEERPLWRSLAEYPLSRPMLFSADELDVPQSPVNCLLINAKCGGEVQMPAAGTQPDSASTVTLGAIAHADDEIMAITNVLLKAIPERVSSVVSIELGEDGAVVTTAWDRSGNANRRPRYGVGFEDVLEEMLTKEGPWQLVHFTGHSHFIGTGQSGVGYVFLPKATARGAMHAPKPISIGKVASWLTDVRFAFLSGCSSSHSDFVYQLCARDVPALSGYPWPVLDNIAWKHSEHFYRRLLQSCSIEEALQKSWLDMFSEHRESWAWASSQFVIQSAA